MSRLPFPPPQDTASSGSSLDAWLERWFWPLLLVGICLNLSGLWVTVMEPDAALYGTVARRIAETGDFVGLIARGTDWLDKPHFPFWVTALTFRFLGVNTVAYKLAAVPFFLMALAYTWLFARRFSGATVARLAVLILVTAQHVIISNNDVRAEPFLIGPIVGSLYHFTRAMEKRWFLQLLCGSVLAAIAVMTKGLFVLIPITAGLVVYWVLHKRWSEFLRPRWILGVLLVAAFISPELLALYLQFDLHPEKVVFNSTNVSGLRFFFWDSQFGRFLNTGPIRGQGNPGFFFHTVLWAFLPWSLWLYAAAITRLWAWRQGNPISTPGETIAWGAGGIAFLVFSLSQFQLPHYLNIVFPFFSIVTASCICRIAERGRQRNFVRMQQVVVGMMFIAPLPLIYASQTPHWAMGLGLVALVAVVVLAIFRWTGLPQVIGQSIGAAVALNLTMNLFFYPALMKYQAGSEAARFIDSLPARPVGMYGMNSFSLEFYSRAPVHRWNLADLHAAVQNGSVYVYLFYQDTDELTQSGLKVSSLRQFDSFPVTRLNGQFLDPRTRSLAVRRAVVAEVWADDVPARQALR